MIKYYKFNKMKAKYKIYFLSLFSGLFLASCGPNQSVTTGWNYNDPKYGGYEDVDFFEQETGPGLVLIEGGTFAMGRTEQDVQYDWNNVPRRVTVSTFYMDQTEIRNWDYLEYLYWLRRIYVDYPEIYRKALPDTNVWREKLAFNEPYVEYYLRHPAYKDYPVVGVSWVQAENYCAWRTDRVNEYILIRDGYLNPDPTGQTTDNNFNTDAFLSGQYQGLVNEQKQSYDPVNQFRNIKMEDGILLPRYRLPTEAEWEFAALGLVGNMLGKERIFNGRIYPWNGHYIRADDRSGYSPDEVGRIRANLVRGRGDYMGMAGALNDQSDITSQVTAYFPNDYGLYAMAGNVNEWVMDVYRPNSFGDFDEFRPFRGNVFKTQIRDSANNYALVERDTLGKIQYRNITDAEAFNRRNYNTADNINFLDGDFESSIDYGEGEGAKKDNTTSARMYNSQKLDNNKNITQYDNKQANVGGGLRGGKKELNSLIDNRARVYKGGGWKDRAYWMAPGARRFLDQEQSRDDLGFRCAMHRVGGSKKLD